VKKRLVEDEMATEPIMEETPVEEPTEPMEETTPAGDGEQIGGTVSVLAVWGGSELDSFLGHGGAI
jgi:hypothetical protein